MNSEKPSVTDIPVLVTEDDTKKKKWYTKDEKASALGANKRNRSKYVQNKKAKTNWWRVVVSTFICVVTLPLAMMFPQFRIVAMLIFIIVFGYSAVKMWQRTMYVDGRYLWKIYMRATVLIAYPIFLLIIAVLIFSQEHFSENISEMMEMRRVGE